MTLDDALLNLPITILAELTMYHLWKAKIQAIIKNVADQTQQASNAIASKCKGRNQFLGKILYLNQLTDMESVLRMYGLYPKLAPWCEHHVSHMYTAYHCIVNQGNSKGPEKWFDKLLHLLNRSSNFKFSVSVSKLLRPMKKITRTRDLSSLLCFWCSMQLHSEKTTSNLWKWNPYLQKENTQVLV